jgi:uncharacterized membrane protein
MGRLVEFFDLFRKGAAVSEPALWKNRSALVMALTALILTGCRVAKGFGYDLPITETDAATLATAIAVVVGLFSTYATSPTVGILPAKPVQPDSPPDPVPARDEPPRSNPVEQHARDFPRDAGGGG